MSTKSLASVIDPRSIVQDSEYIETHLVAVPSQLVKDFLKTYETIAPMVVPRSAQLVAEDSEFSLFAVTAFKKHSLEFVHKCREQKWIPRDFKYVEGGKEEERKEVERVGGDERKLWGETLRLGRTAWSEAVMVWIHVLVLRVFVETVLRYGLPLDFVCGLIRVRLHLLMRAGWLSMPLRKGIPNLACAMILTSLGFYFIFSRHPRNKQTRPRAAWKKSTHTWRVMPLGETRRVGSSEMTRVRCMPPVRAMPTTHHMSITNLSSSERWRKRRRRRA